MPPKKMILVDGSNHAFRFFHAMPPMMAAGLPTGALYGFAQLIKNLERNHKPDYLVFVFDRGKSFRADIYPDYKGHRPETPPDLAAQWPLFSPLVEAWGYRCLALEGFEADDIIGTLARRFEGPELEVFIASGDKDFAQLVDEHVKLLDLRKDEHAIQGIAEVQERFGVPPARVLDILALWGDASDNIPGVPGVGEKKARALIEQFGTLEQVLARAPEIKGKIGENLVLHAEDARMSMRLARIVTDLDLPLSLQDLQDHQRDEPALRALLERFQFRSLLSELALSHETPSAPAMSVASKELRTRADLERFLRSARELGRVSLFAHTSPGRAEDAQALGKLGLALRPGEAFHLDLHSDPKSELYPLLTALLADPTIQKVCFDLKNLWRICDRAGLRLEGFDRDVLLVDALLEPDRDARSFDDLSERWLGIRTITVGPAQTSLFPSQELPPQEVAERAETLLRMARAQEPLLQREQMAELLDQVEIKVPPVLADMERHGIRLDPKALAQLGRELGERISIEERKIHELAGHPFAIGSPKQLAEVLFDERGLKSQRKTKTGRSTDAETLEALSEGDDPLPAAVLIWRSLTRLKNTYVDALPNWVSPTDQRVHTTFLQTIASTGRLSSIDPNLQNIPIRTAEGRLIRRCFIPEPGHVFVSADYSQIELRVLADRCAEGPLFEAFLRNEDIHRRTAAEVFGLAPELVSQEQRRAAKAINFGIVYGMGAFRLSRDLGIGRREAQRTIDGYFEKYPQVRGYIEQAIQDARERGYAITQFGRRRPIRDMNATVRHVREAAERVAINTPIQGSAAEIMKISMVKVWARMKQELPDVRLLLQVHDELVVEAPEHEVEAVKHLLVQEMSAAVKLRVPLVVQTQSGRNWEECH